MCYLETAGQKLCRTTLKISSMTLHWDWEYGKWYTILYILHMHTLRMYRKSSFARYKIVCVWKNEFVTWWQCPAWHGSDSAWHCVTESVTRPSVRLSPPFRLQLSSPHSLTTCNFAKLSEKCSVTVSKYSNAAIFKVQSLWGFPQNPDSTPALLESAACLARGMSQCRDIQ